MLTTDFINWIRQCKTILQCRRNNKKNMTNIFLQIVFIRNYLFDYVSKIYIDQAKNNKRICTNYRNVINLTIFFYNNIQNLMYALVLFFTWCFYYSYSSKAIVLKTENDKKTKDYDEKKNGWMVCQLFLFKISKHGNYIWKKSLTKSLKTLKKFIFKCIRIDIKHHITVSLFL